MIFKYGQGFSKMLNMIRNDSGLQSQTDIISPSRRPHDEHDSSFFNMTMVDHRTRNVGNPDLGQLDSGSPIKAFRDNSPQNRTLRPKPR
jgi:hypothetical protein